MNSNVSTTSAASELTAAPVAAPVVVSAKPVLPEWTRLPKTGSHDPWCGLTRSKINELVLPCAANDFKPPVRSICLRKKGAAKGIRLIHLRSLLDYLESQGNIQPVVLPKQRRALDQGAEASGEA